MARAYHHGDLANALVAASLELVEANGVEAFNLREAAARCGVGVSAIYKHYASKSDLLRAVADVGFATLVERLEGRVRVATRGLQGVAQAEARLVELGRTYILFAKERPNLFRLMYGPVGDGRRPVGAFAKRVFSELRGALLDVVRCSGRADVDLEAALVVVWSLVHGFAVLVIDGVWRPTDARALDDMISAHGQAALRTLR